MRTVLFIEVLISLAESKNIRTEIVQFVRQWHERINGAA